MNGTRSGNSCRRISSDGLTGRPHDALEAHRLMLAPVVSSCTQN